MSYSNTEAEQLGVLMSQHSSKPITLYQPEMWIPHYPASHSGSWQLRPMPLLTMQGYWGDGYLVNNGFALLHGNGETWMSVTPSELESQQLGWQLAYGHTVILGFGMGIAACNAALNPRVSRVTVVEYDPAILALADQAQLLAQLPAEAAQKLQFIQGDARQWQPQSKVHTVLADYWLPFYGAERVAEMQAVQANIQAESVFFWGQELNLAMTILQRHGRAVALDDAALAQLIGDEWQLPLLWPRQQGYGERVLQAARHWLPLALRQSLIAGN